MPLRLFELFMIALFCCIAWTACTKLSGKNVSKNKTSAPPKNMQQVLADTRSKLNSPGNMFCAEAKIARFDSILAASKDANIVLNTSLQKGLTLLEYGEERQAVDLLERVKKAVGNSKDALKLVDLQLGVAYLRLGERDNCVMGHNEDACIMPIQNKGIHNDKTGARKAAELFAAVLQLDPENYDAIWLLNIAHMTLGEYPQNVPKQWLIPNLDAPGYPVKPFLDMAPDLKIVASNRAGGSIVEDFDNDGNLDLVTSAWDMGDPMHFFKNNGDGTFTDRSAETGLKTETGGLNIQQTDYNNDGNIDIFVLRGAWQGQGGIFGEQPNSLLRNNGDGTFTDVTIEAGLLSFRPTQTATWNDFNHDGWLDVFIANESMQNDKPYPCEFYLNNHDGTFRNATKELNVEVKLFVKAVISGDYDNDGWPDLFFSSMDGHKLLLRNTGLNSAGMVGFENMSAKAGFDKEVYRSFPTAFFDYDNDGWLDIFICNYDFDRALSYYFGKEFMHPSNDKAGKIFFYHNNHDGTFKNVTADMGLFMPIFSMGANFGDINNDGWLDIYLGTGNPSYQSLVPNRLFVNLEGKKFADATNASRTGSLQKGHGVSFADIDNDGDQDIHIDIGGAYRGDGFPNALYVNPGQNDNHWIYLQLEGVKSNRPGIGTKITVKFHENGKSRMVYRELNSGASFGSSPFRREIGVGKATTIDEIKLVWPSGLTQTLKNIAPNQMIKIKEGTEGYTPAGLNKMTFKRADGSIPMCAPTK